MLALPDSLRSEFKEPMGAVYADAETLLSDADDPIVAVGDVVTYHLRRAGRNPDVAVVDGRTEREAVDDSVRRVLDDDTRRVEATNPPASLSESLLDALVAAVDADGPVVVDVDGEEDLATLPALLLLDGGSVVYGQPGEGMVLVAATPATRERARSLLERFDGDVDAAFARLGV
jgi:uncharacterized protein (UPF0218 family)